MADKFKPQARRTRSAGLVLLTLAIVWAAIHYNRYAYAIAWHCIHGNYTQVGGCRVRLPVLWWAEKDPVHYDTYLLVRASSSSRSLPPGITVQPALQGSGRDTNEEELSAVQSLVALKDSKATAGVSSSLVTLHPKKFILYCERREFVPFNISLYCAAAKVSYVWSYFGAPSYEKEADLILSTLE